MHCAGMTCSFGRADSDVWEPFFPTLCSAFCLASTQLCKCIKDSIYFQLSSSYVNTTQALITCFTFEVVQINDLTICTLNRLKFKSKFNNQFSDETFIHQCFYLKYKRLSLLSVTSYDLISLFTRGY